VGLVADEFGYTALTELENIKGPLGIWDRARSLFSAEEIE